MSCQFEDTKGAITSRKWKDRQSNGPQKGQTMIFKTLQQKTKDRDTLIPLKIVDALRYYGIITVSGPLVAPVMLLLLQTGDKS